MMMPCSRAGPSRGGPAARSRPCAAALAASLAMVGLVLVQGDVAGVGAGDEGDPLLAGHW